MSTRIMRIEPIKTTNRTPESRVGGKAGEALDLLLGAMRGSTFRICWTGSKIPRGARFGGGTIAWAQHGRLIGANGETLGTYRRVREFSGKNRDEHEMEAWSVRPQVTP